MRSIPLLAVVLVSASLAIGPAAAVDDPEPDNCKVTQTIQPGTHTFTIEDRHDVDTFKLDLDDHDTAYMAVLPDSGETKMFVYAVPSYLSLEFSDPMPADTITYGGTGQGIWSTYRVDEITWKMTADEKGTTCLLIYESTVQETDFPYDYELRISLNEEPDWWAPLREQLARDAREGSDILTRSVPPTPRHTPTPTTTETPTQTAEPDTPTPRPTSPPDDGTPEPTPTPTPTPAPGTGTTASGGDTTTTMAAQTPTDEPTPGGTIGGGGPGFGPLSALIAVVALGVIALGRRGR